MLVKCKLKLFKFSPNWLVNKFVRSNHLLLRIVMVILTSNEGILKVGIQVDFIKRIKECFFLKSALIEGDNTNNSF